MLLSKAKLANSGILTLDRNNDCFVLCHFTKWPTIKPRNDKGLSSTVRSNADLSFEIPSHHFRSIYGNPSKINLS